MGRRSFATITRNLDVTPRLKKEEELPRPWSPEALFGRAAPLEFEIGSGKGMFIRKAAEANPDHDFLGVEVSYRYALISAAGLVKAERDNALMICADAAKLLAEWVPPASLTAVHVYFPDPWWKKSHRKRRIIRSDVVRLIENRLLPGGKLHFWTDVEEYFRSALEIIRNETSLTGPFPVPDPELSDWRDEKMGGEERAAAAMDADRSPLIRDDEPNRDDFRTGESQNVPYYGENGDQNPPAVKNGEGDFLSHFERRTRLNHLPVWRSLFIKPASP